MGHVPLDPVQARHAREVLRLSEGTTVEVFDDSGASALGQLIFPNGRDVAVKVERIIEPPTSSGLRLVVASAVPRGERADWMVEKLSELGVFALIPLTTQRSIVHPTGKSKYERWKRIATESAKQSKRPGVMRIDELTSVGELLTQQVKGIVLSTAPDSRPFALALPASKSHDLHLFIGPEGGWTHPELAAFQAAGIEAARLTNTVLRVETAAIVAAAVVIAQHGTGDE